MELHKSGYISQICAYLQNADHENAYALSKDFSQAFPDDLESRYLLAESAFWAGRYDEAVIEGSRAFNQSSSKEDMLACTIITASAYYELKQYEKGISLLKTMENRGSNEDIERLRFIFSIAIGDGKEAAIHANDLYAMNQKAAIELVAAYLR